MRVYMHFGKGGLRVRALLYQGKGRDNNYLFVSVSWL